MRISVFRKAHFNAAHRLYRPDWTDERNEAVFGLCSNEHYHGHNYEMEVKVSGEKDQAKNVNLLLTHSLRRMCGLVDFLMCEFVILLQFL